AAGTEMAGEVQRGRPRAVGGASVRAGVGPRDFVAAQPTVPGHLRRRVVPAPLSPIARRPGRAAADAGVVPCDPGPCPALGARGRVAAPAGRTPAAGTRDGGATAAGDAERGPGALQLS